MCIDQEGMTNLFTFDFDLFYEHWLTTGAKCLHLPAEPQVSPEILQDWDY
jgi:hypothetical protein